MPNVRGQTRPTDITIKFCSEEKGLHSRELVGRSLHPLVQILGCFRASKVHSSQMGSDNRGRFSVAHIISLMRIGWIGRYNAGPCVFSEYSLPLIARVVISMSAL